jgi:hypothetical protein
MVGATLAVAQGRRKADLYHGIPPISSIRALDNKKPGNEPGFFGESTARQITGFYGWSLKPSSRRRAVNSVSMARAASGVRLRPTWYDVPHLGQGPDN